MDNVRFSLITRHSSLVTTLVVIVFLLMFSAPRAQSGERLTGFSAVTAAKQLEYEARLKQIPDGEHFKEALQAITKDPHIAGTPESELVIAYLRTQLGQYGWRVETASYWVYMPMPKEIDVELVTPIREPLNTREYIYPEDPFSAHPKLLGGWNAYSGVGDVTGAVVYANYGRKEDFEQLQKLGVDVTGKIVIVRYGENFRGYKAKYAEDKGAIGCLIYSDPKDVGYVAGDVYPQGRYLPNSGIQRGSLKVLDYPGDPLTPGQPAIEGVRRLDPSQVPLIRIPVTPLPYGSAQEILSRMGGSAVPQDWQGGLPFTYHLGGDSAVTVRLHVEHEYKSRKITNVIGTLDGTDYPDEWIIAGSHHDAWTFGAVDPSGGTVALLEAARAMGQLAKEGWRPRRTVKMAFWDGEEFGLLGSTEWVEQWAKDLNQKGVAYLNADGSVSGPDFSASSAPLCKQVIIEAAQAVPYPHTDRTVYDLWMETQRKQDPKLTEPNISDLGGGSDHVGLYCFIGIPSCEIEMNGPSPIYHSAYDNFTWFARFADPDFVYGPTLTRLDGVVLARLANADLIPYDISRYVTDTRRHIEGLVRLAEKRGTPGLRFPKLASALDVLETQTAATQQRLTAAVHSGTMERKKAMAIDGKLIALERQWLVASGLQRGAWYKSLYGSPDPFSGYAPWVLPGLRYEIETGDWANLPKWEDVYVEAVHRVTATLGEIVDTLER